MFSFAKKTLGNFLTSTVLSVVLLPMIVQADDAIKNNSDEPASLELKLEQMSFRYNSVDGSVWELCAVEKAKQTHDFAVKCGDYRFTAHVLFRIWPASHGAPPDERTYDLLVMVDRHESNGSITAAVTSTVINVASGGKVNKITADVGFDNGNYNLQTRIDLNAKSN